MQLKKITIQNFKCFENEEIDLSLPNGLYMLTGENRQNVSMGANGIGKTTLFDAICWCIYGKTAKGHTAGRLLNRNNSSKGYSVKLEFEDAVIFRSWTPGKKQLRGVDVTDEDIAEFIGLTFEQFLYSVYFPQLGSQFIDLTPGGKLSFLSMVFGLDRWVNIGTWVKNKHAAAETDLKFSQSDIDALQKQVDYIESSMTEVKAQMKQWDETEAQSVDTIRASLIALETSAPTKPAPIDELIAKAKTLVATEAKYVTDLKKTTDNLIQLAARKIQNQVNKDTALREAEKLVNNLGGTCTLCKQTIGEEHVTTQCSQLLSDVNTYEELAPKIVEEIETESTHQNNLNTALADLRNTLIEISTQQKQHEQDTLIYNQHVALIETTKTSINTRPTNPYIATKDKYTADIKNLKKTIEEKETAHKIAQETVLKYEFWAKRFPMVRLAILDQLIEDLEIHFNQALNSFGLLDWSVKLSTERELKNKNTSKELVVTLYERGEEVDLDLLSGGEQQRLRLATILGIADLVKHRKDCQWNLWLFDEPSTGLSPEGTYHMIELLNYLAETQLVLLSDHKMLDAGRFSGVLSLIKGGDKHTKVSCLTN